VKASVKLKRNDKAMGSSDDEQRDSRSRLRFWRRDGEANDSSNDNDDDGSGHDR
jgi:hypothetical protein